MGGRLDWRRLKLGLGFWMKDLTGEENKTFCNCQLNEFRNVTLTTIKN